MASDVQEYVREHPFGQPPITPGHPDWSFYKQILDTSTTYPSARPSSIHTSTKPSTYPSSSHPSIKPSTNSSWDHPSINTSSNHRCSNRSNHLASTSTFTSSYHSSINASSNNQMNNASNHQSSTSTHPSSGHRFTFTEPFTDSRLIQPYHHPSINPPTSNPSFNQSTIFYPPYIDPPTMNQPQSFHPSHLPSRSHLSFTPSFHPSIHPFATQRYYYTRKRRYPE
ncbi:hypothetical protein AMTR_s00154p00086420 [Amborella trichopoda]|uniref:Uncharacterized protein n=2 Tax=Amborella trichopoda TaxID=13333 RepID=W1PIU6_AMBTC|nr:hypothetical protein AMTR_s00154p00086420 [Amborella trichopoda]